MLTPFKKYLDSIITKPETKSFLLAVSGGVDSVVMADLFHKAGYKFAIAHCNFQLRGKESDGDEQFVKSIAVKYKVVFYNKSFDTAAFVEKEKVSVQMAARQLRYDWFNEIRQKHKYDNIVIAHHADDAVETFFINLLRGTGIAGLHGISANHENVIRPLLALSRKDIEEYASGNKLKWREDSSNASNKYERNRIRHHVIPELLKVNPDAAKAIGHTIENLRATEAIYREAVETKLKKLMVNRNGKIYITVNGLLKLDYPVVYLYEYLKDFGFNYAQVKEVIEALKGQSGKVFLSNGHRLVKDRHNLVLERLPKKAVNKPGFINDGDTEYKNEQLNLQIEIKDKPTGFKPLYPSSVGCFDYSKLTFPLTIRKWKQGDRFYPLGMNKQKKISDLLIDTKVPVTDKDEVYIMLSGEDIVWVIGHRIDERFKIVPATKKLYICNIVNLI